MHRIVGWILALVQVFACGAVLAQAPQSPPRSPELVELDAKLNAILELAKANPSDPRIIALIEPIGPRVAAVVQRDLASTSQDSRPWLDALWAIREAYEKAGRMDIEIGWRDLWLLATAKLTPVVGSGADWFYVALLDAKYRAPDVFKQAVEFQSSLWVERHGKCHADYVENGAAVIPTAACELQLGSMVLRGIAAIAAGLDFERAAVAMIEQGRSVPPHAHFRALFTLAQAEWENGTAAEAERLLDQLDSLERRAGAALNDNLRQRFFLLKAEIADARLDDDQAMAYLKDALRLVRGDSSGSAGAAQASAMLPLARRFLAREACVGCAADQSRAVKDVYRTLLALAASTPAKGFFAQSYAGDVAAAYLDSVLYPNLLTDSEREGLGRRLVQAQMQAHVEARQRWRDWRAKYPAQAARGVVRQPPDVLGLTAKRLRRHMPAERAPAIGAALLTALYIDAGTIVGIGADDIAQFLGSPDMATARRLAPRTIKVIVNDHYLQFGNDLGSFADMSQLARWMHAAGLKPAAQATLEILWEMLEQRLGSRSDSQTAANLANVMVPALVRLAGYEVAAKRWQVADRYLTQAAAMTRLRLDREWRAGNARALSAVRDILPALRQMAELRITMSVAAPPAKADKAHEAAFEALQLALLQDTALTLQTAIRRRIASTPHAAAALERRERLQGQVDSLSETRRYITLPMPGIEQAEAKARAELMEADAELVRALGSAAYEATITPVALAEARGQLRPNEGLLILVEGPRQASAFLLTGKGARVWPIKLGGAALAQAVTRIRGGIDLSSGQFPVFPVLRAAELFDAVLGPARSDLAGLTALVVVANGALQSLPLGVLPTEAPFGASGDLSEMKWLARTHAVTQMPSVGSFVAQRMVRIATSASKPFLGVGNPRLASIETASRDITFRAAFKQGPIADVEFLRSAPELPETEEELRAIAAVLGAGPADLLLAEDATESTLKSRDLTSYRIISFATHGLIAGALGALSEPGLVLTPPASGTAEDDGLLTMSEIMTLKLKADLVILSACDTATSDGRPRADGLSGLARAFFAAGAQSLLVTHWAIPSKPAVALTTAMVRARQANPQSDWAEALQMAQLQMLENRDDPTYAHPASWAGFQIVGTSPKGGTLRP